MAITITLEDDEALVLFELLASEKLEKAIQSLDSAEHGAVWALEASLERVLAEPFRENYAELLAQAKQAVADRCGK